MRLNVQECRIRFGRQPVARMATIAEDGSPRLVPITFITPGQGGSDVIYSAVDEKPKSTRALARLARIERDPRVSLLADEYSDDWSKLWWVRADALAAVHAPGREWDRVVALLAEKYEQYRAQPPTGAVIRFVIQGWSGWAASQPGTSMAD